LQRKGIGLARLFPEMGTARTKSRIVVKVSELLLINWCLLYYRMRQL
jgi:hypothetical protein